ncbi:MAG: 3-isopropylmalate dehydratase large subunit [Henriciella sp.]
MTKMLYEKIWERHVVKYYNDRDALIYVDRHLVQEVSSPQAFEGLKQSARALRRPNAHIAVADHAVPTSDRHLPFRDKLAKAQVERLTENVTAFDIPYIPLSDDRHGIVHVIGPELGFTLPGATLVCGDSHTSTHGAFGALAFGIGSSECETVFATQCVRQTKQKTMRVILNGTLKPGVTVKDIILSLIARIGTSGGQNHAIEYCGPAVDAMSMEERMTLCNMSIEAGARVGMVAPDETTFQYLADKPLAPKGPLWDQAITDWRTLRSDPDAVFDKTIELDVSNLAPQVSWGTTPADCSPVTGSIPETATDARIERALAYMGLQAGQRLKDIKIDKVFIGSCTNSRIEDLRLSAEIVRDRRVAADVKALVVPGSAAVQKQAEAEGLDAVFKQAGFDWRDAGCSMCVAMNEDRLKPGERCASTSNRNFEGRQGQGGRTHLMSPQMAAAAAVTGKITDVRELMEMADA